MFGETMQILGYSLLILVSLQWNFYNSLDINKNMGYRFMPERKLKSYFEKKEALRKNRWKDFKSFRTAIKSWVQSVRRFNVCRLSRKQKQYLCASILLTERYGHVLPSYEEDRECVRHKVTFAEIELASEKKDRGKQVLKMFPCKLELNTKILYYISGTGEKKPSVYFFVQDITDEANPGPIHVDAYVTNINMDELTEEREIEKHPRKNTWIGDDIIHPVQY